LKDNQWWRLLTSALSHVAFFHFAFNAISLWSYRQLELFRGSAVFFADQCVILVGSVFLMLLIDFLRLKYLHHEQIRNTFTLGYSGLVLFVIGYWLLFIVIHCC